MTTTSIYSGIENVSKPTSRVSNPPGGKTSFSLGGYGEEPTPQEVKKPTLEDVDPETQEQEEDEQSEQAVKPAAGLNPVTGEANERGALEEAADLSPSKGRAAKPDRVDPSTLPAAGGRVEGRNPMKRQPPGGKDSGIFS